VKLGICTIKPSNVWVLKAMASHDVSLLSDFFFYFNSFLMASTFFNFGIMIYWRWHFFLGEYVSLWKLTLGRTHDMIILLSSSICSFSTHLFITPAVISSDTSSLIETIISPEDVAHSVQCIVCAIWWHCWTGRKFRLQHADEPSRQRDGYPIVETILTPTSRWPCHIRFIDDSFNSTETFAK
jgi:hypothetical protein